MLLWATNWGLGRATATVLALRVETMSIALGRTSVTGLAYKVGLGSDAATLATTLALATLATAVASDLRLILGTTIIAGGWLALGTIAGG